ncbi:uncharacterized protein BDR25DRAFT_91667 [Lindgomyces ingoldianus]|uniref:Uncharacterized protein n=1 Tax=Lindgomyces ingoldianus TaxID=673940 RepID=A0ACB6QE98_9PLEO|nr:uncharacterized protein BDR25DRAFT_91667 [Lindgomyces ingoldianus]KAF2465221.1 hypothetical protein BDR25DRAFT_91667 [Lindgomyces ingoldianus]
MAGLPPIKKPPGPDISSAPKLLGITGGLYIVALLLYGGRMYTRLRPTPRLGWDDYTITAALILALIEWSLFTASVSYGAGRHNYYVPADKQIPAQHLLFSSTVPWAASMMFIKISIACMLLRIKRTRPWIIFLWTMIAIQIASCVASLVFQLVQCRPLAVIWNPAAHPNAVCTKPESAFISIYVNSSIAIATDLTFAVLPITFIRKMNRPLREKLVLSILMGLGVFAAAASIVKTTLVKNYGITGDSLWDAIDLTLWSILEEQTGIIAACIPCLKSPFEKVLGRMGLLSSKGRTAYGRSGYQNYGQSGSNGHQLSNLRSNRTGVGMSSGKASDAQSEESILHSDDDKVFTQAAGGKIVKTTELHFSEEEIPKVEREDLDPMERKKASGKWHAV